MGNHGRGVHLMQCHFIHTVVALMLLTMQKALCMCNMFSTSRSYSVLYVLRAEDLLTTAV